MPGLKERRERFLLQLQNLERRRNKADRPAANVIDCGIDPGLPSRTVCRILVAAYPDEQKGRYTIVFLNGEANDLLSGCLTRAENSIMKLGILVTESGVFFNEETLKSDSLAVFKDQTQQQALAWFDVALTISSQRLTEYQRRQSFVAIEEAFSADKRGKQSRYAL